MALKSEYKKKQASIIIHVVAFSVVLCALIVSIILLYKQPIMPYLFALLVFFLLLTIAFLVFFFRNEGKRYLRKTRERLRTIFTKQKFITHELMEYSFDYYCVLDESLRIQHINESMVLGCGFLKTDMIGTSFLEFIHVDDRTEFQQIIASLHASEIFRNFGFRCRHGHEQWNILIANIKCNNQPQTKEKEIWLFMQNITENITLARNLYEVEDKYRMIVERSSLGVVLLVNDMVMFINDRLCEMLHLTKDALFEKPWHQFVTIINKHAYESSQDGSLINYTCDISPPDKNSIKAEVYEQHVLFKGKPARQLIFVDITERERLKRKTYMAQKMESIGRLAGGIAHDFNNFLGVILGYTNIIKEELDRKSDAFNYVERIEDSALEAAELIKQLLGFSRLGKYEDALLDANQIVMKIKRIIINTLSKNISLELQLNKSISKILGDQSQLQQVLLNLCFNARDAMPEGGILTITTSNTKLSEKFCQRNEGAQPGKYVSISVSDTGAGIPPDVQNKMFEPFFSTKPDSSGLGLSTVYGIVKNHSGYITFTSAPNVGATFTVYLPFAKISSTTV